MKNAKESNVTFIGPTFQVSFQRTTGDNLQKVCALIKIFTNKTQFDPPVQNDILPKQLLSELKQHSVLHLFARVLPSGMMRTNVSYLSSLMLVWKKYALFLSKKKSCDGMCVAH